jgi:hypothetical protein
MSILNDEMMAPYKNAKRETFHTAAVGVTFRNKDEIEAVETGDFALLSPELDNEHDSTAVAIIHNLTGNKIGYIKRELNSDIWNNIIKTLHIHSSLRLLGIAPGTSSNKLMRKCPTHTFNAESIITKLPTALNSSAHIVQLFLLFLRRPSSNLIHQAIVHAQASLLCEKQNFKSFRVVFNK